jgi:hypothetical protein
LEYDDTIGPTFNVEEGGGDEVILELDLCQSTRVLSEDQKCVFSEVSARMPLKLQVLLVLKGVNCKHQIPLLLFLAAHDAPPFLIYITFCKE